MNKITESITLKRKDNKVVPVTFYDISDINTVPILDIKTLKFEGMAVKDIKKSQIHEEVLKGEEKIYLQNYRSKIVAGLSKKHLNKIISTIFTRDIESRHAYLKKELITNVDTIFYSSIPILKHPELKKEILFDCQIVHRLALPLKIGGLIFFILITVKERTDFKKAEIDEFTIYDLYSETQENKKSSGSSSTASVGNNPMTSRSQYRMTNYSIYDLIEFVKSCIQKY